MPGRMSNKDRIARLAAEKAAGRKEKAEKKKARVANPRATTRKTLAAKASTGPRRLVWLVCDQAGNPVKTYPYPARAEADAEAARLSETKSKLHFVKSDKVPMEE